MVTLVRQNLIQEWNTMKYSTVQYSAEQYTIEYNSRYHNIQPEGNLHCMDLLQRSWWRHQTKTFSPLLAICVGNSPVPGEFPAQRAVTRSFDVFFDLRLNKRLSKQSWGWWFETLPRPLWLHCNILSAFSKQSARWIFIPKIEANWSAEL